MPRGKRRPNQHHKSTTEALAGKGRDLDMSDDESYNDNASVISNISYSTSNEERSGVATDETDDAQNDAFEEKLSDAIDGLSQKSAQGRTLSFEAVCNIFCKKYIPDYILNRRMTITDSIERALKKGGDNEKAAAANLASLLCIQLGAMEMAENSCQELLPVLMFVANDESVPLLAREKCCLAIALLTFISCNEEIDAAMQLMRNLWSRLLHSTTISPSIAALYSAALSSWSLLLSTVSIRNSTIIPTLAELSILLDSTHLEVRMATGELITVLLEMARECEDMDEYEPDEEFINKLRELATDSQKYRAKKDRKTQRSNFRQILHYVELDEPPNIQIRFGQEILTMNSWIIKKQYDVLCQALGSGMNMHMTENDLIRDILNLGPKLCQTKLLSNKQSKLERQQINAANFKVRTKTRGKVRDKRIAFID
ncbi:interferon-related developmental regulator 2 isoform X1 [Aphis gossypii]|uniref:interferon-related developmental regulator 2 isoform X1 n=1 Tax=Aphis gossypii TaxID=80765 RepID=UPI002158BC23|nr:interferon-related developmental regulator 2 isoform X1 [Aphis gossypii]